MKTTLVKAIYNSDIDEHELVNIKTGEVIPMSYDNIITAINSVINYTQGVVLRHCKARVYYDGVTAVLQSYNTIVAFIYHGVCYDIHRYVNDYTATNAQHINKFCHDYNATEIIRIIN